MYYPAGKLSDLQLEGIVYAVSIFHIYILCGMLFLKEN